MARCVSLQHSPRLSAASALAFHDESILALLQDTSRDLFPASVSGVTACSWDNGKTIRLTLAGVQSCSMRQVQIRNEGSKESLYFLGAALIPPLDPKIASVEVSDDFGVCCEASQCEAYESGRMQEKLAALGKVACHLGPGTSYFVSVSCKMVSRPEAPSSRRHLLVLAFHDSMAGSSAGESHSSDDCFHLFVGVHIDMASGIHEAPVLSQLRTSAPPFFPDYLHRLFDTPTQWFLVATPPPDDASFAGFSHRQHVPAWVDYQMSAAIFTPEAEILCSDGYPPTVTPGSMQELAAGVNEEENAMRTGIKHFDMFHAVMTSVATLPQRDRRRLGIREEGLGQMFKLEVPGLHEGKPPVYRGDAVHIRVDGFVQIYELCCCAVIVSFSTLVVQLPGNPIPLQAKNRVHVRFSIDINRIHSMRHAATVLLNSPQWSLFGLEIPEPPHGGLDEWRVLHDVEEFPARAGHWFGLLNEQQRYVVEAVHSMEKGSPPFLLVGPPGTGKSWAIAETVCQFMFCHLQRVLKKDDKASQAKILLCAPTDVACDLLVETVQQHLQPTSSCDTVAPIGLMLRFNEPRRPLQQLFGRSAVLQYCSIDDSTGSFIYPGHDALREAVVVVCTLRAAWTLSSYMHGSGIAFDYILVDEAGQALELEVYAALALGNHDCRVLLSGDPKQLGPVCRAAQHSRNDLVTNGLVGKMRVSLLERLCENHPRWKSLDSRWVVRLYRNYRSHPAILDIMSSTRYDGRLVAHADEKMVRKFENLELFPVKGFPLTFLGVRGQQQMDVSNENQHCLSRPDIAHSYHNPEEALVVVNLVSRLLTNGEEATGVLPNDIGIVCAFRRQVQKIRGLLRAEGFGSVRVGTVEDYQGQQERILIISTTLSDPSQVSTLQQLDAEPEPAASDGKPRKNKIRHMADANARSKIIDALEACIRTRARRDEWSESGLQAVGRQTEDIIGSVRRFTVALSRAQCALIVVGCPEVLEISTHWRRFLLYLATHNALQGELPSNSLLSVAGVTVPPKATLDTEDTIFKGIEEHRTRIDAHASSDEKSLEDLARQARRWQISARESEALVERYAQEISAIGAELRGSRAAWDEATKCISTLERRLQEEADDRLCVVCTVEPKNVALFPCGHVSLCRNCAPMLLQTETIPQCPNCRTVVERTSIVYL